MKKLLLRFLVCAFALAIAPSVMAQTKLFKEASAYNSVTSIYLSPNALRLGADAGTIGHGLDEAIVDLQELEIITTALNVGEVMISCNKVINNLGLELLIDIYENDEGIKLYAELDDNVSNAPGKKGKTVDKDIMAKRIVLEVYGRLKNYGYTMIYMQGEINLSELISNNRFK